MWVRTKIDSKLSKLYSGKEGNDKRLRHQRWPQQENHLLVLIRAGAYLPLVMANDGRSHNSSPTNQWDEIGINNRKKNGLIRSLLYFY